MFNVFAVIVNVSKKENAKNESAKISLSLFFSLSLHGN